MAVIFMRKSLVASPIQISLWLRDRWGFVISLEVGNSVMRF